MKTLAKLIPLDRHEIGDELMSRLLGIYPEGRFGKHGFSMKLPADDPRAINIVRTLQLAGMTQFLDSLRSPIPGKEYWIEYSRSYDKGDFESASCLMPQPTESLDCVRSYERDELVLAFDKLNNKLDFASDAAGTGLVVPNRTRLCLEQSSLRGIRFRPTLLKDETRDPDEQLQWGDIYGDPWWELCSDVTLPPLSPKMVITDRKKNPVQRGTPGFVLVHDDPRFIGIELHYLRSEIEAMPEFDFAQSVEWASASPLDRWLVVSKRFYEFCKKNRLKCEFVPVRIDEG